MPRVSRTRAEDHRAAITEASARLFTAHGPKGASMAELIGAARVRPLPEAAQAPARGRSRQTTGD